MAATCGAKQLYPNCNQNITLWHSLPDEERKEWLEGAKIFGSTRSVHCDAAETPPPSLDGRFEAAEVACLCLIIFFA